MKLPKIIEHMKNRSQGSLCVGGHRGHIPKAQIHPSSQVDKFYLDEPLLTEIIEVQENTVKNLELLRGSKISHAEIDLQLSKDKIITVYHDLYFTYQGKKHKISDFNYSDLQRILGLNSLEEMLTFAKDEKLPLALELKLLDSESMDRVEQLIKELLSLLHDFDFFDWSFILSVRHAVLYQLKKLETRVNLAPIFTKTYPDPVRQMEEINALIYLSAVENLSIESVADLHQNGYYVDGSVVNSVSRLNKALSLPVDILESDAPLAVLDWIENRK